MKKNILGLCVAMLFVAPTVSQAATFNVKALENSTSGGTGVAVAFNVGDAFTVSVNPLDLWNAGALPRWSNANGLISTDLFATGLPDPTGDNPAAAGTLIGNDHGLHSQGGLSAPFGSLVGAWSSTPSTYFLIGTNYAGVAAASTLNLYYFDSNNGDNTGSINVEIAAVPEPETYAMMLAGLGLIGFSARRRKS